MRSGDSSIPIGSQAPDPHEYFVEHITRCGRSYRAGEKHERRFRMMSKVPHPQPREIQHPVLVQVAVTTGVLRQRLVDRDKPVDCALLDAERGQVRQKVVAHEKA